MPFSHLIKQSTPFLVFIAAVAALMWVIVHHFGANDISASNIAENSQRLAAENSEPVKDGAVITTNMWKMIPSWHLFGEYKPVVAPPIPRKEIAIESIEPDLSNIPETRIPLKLSGIAFSTTQDNAFAMIITPDGHQAEYQTGENIGTEASVHRIEERRVVIERDGKFEALSLPETSNATRSNSRTVRTRSPRNQIRPTPNQKKILIDNEPHNSDPEA